MRIVVESAVERWFEAQPPESIWTTFVLTPVDKLLKVSVATAAQASDIDGGASL